MSEEVGAMDRLMNRVQVPARDARIESPPVPEPEEPVPPEDPFDFEVSKHTVRIEKEMLRKISLFCSDHSITKDVLLEAAYIAASENERFKARLLRVAKDRKQERDHIGMKRRLRSLNERYGD